MSIATVVTRGYGSFGSIPFVVTRGYSIGSEELGLGETVLLTANIQQAFVDDASIQRALIGDASIQRVFEFDLER